MKKILILVTGLIIIIGQAANAQTMRFNAEQYINEKGDTLNYRISYPDYSESERYPLVIFLHGGGERGNDNRSQLKWGVQNFVSDETMMTYKAIVLAPQSPSDAKWSNFEGQFEDRYA